MFGYNKTPAATSLEQRSAYRANCTVRRNGKVVERWNGSTWVGETYNSVNSAKRAIRESGLKSYTV